VKMAPSYKLDNNSLIEFISKVENTSPEEGREKATKLKEKLLRYCVPVIGDNEEQLVEMRFYPNEAGNMIDILLYAVDGVITTNNYYEVLLGVRAKIKEERTKKE
ncbi:MAG: hypothetical protein ACI4PF_04205, partial [Christensenellales bacterium]